MTRTSTSVRARKPRRVKKKRPRRSSRFGLRLWLLFLFLIKFSLTSAVLVCACWLGMQIHVFLYQSDYFDLDSIVVLGADERLERELISLGSFDAEEPFNLFAIDVEAVEGKLGKHPRVKSVDVTKKYPGGLDIIVEERVPLAVVVSDKLYLMDKERLIIGRLSPDELENYDLPFVSGLLSAQVALGERVGSAGMDRVLETILELNRVDPNMAARFSEFHIKDGADVTAYLKGGLKVYFGYYSPLEKMVSLETFLKKYSAEAEDCEYVDLRFEDQIVFLPKGGRDAYFEKEKSKKNKR